MLTSDQDVVRVSQKKGVDWVLCVLMSKGSPVSGKKRGLPVGGSALPRSDKKNHSDESRSYTLGDEDDGEGLEERKDLGEAKKLGKYVRTH